MESELRARRTDTRGIGDPSAVNPRHAAGKPKWAKDNEYIQSGFRPISNSYLDCLKSSLEVHNETGNIYTHFFPSGSEQAPSNLNIVVHEIYLMIP